MEIQTLKSYGARRYMEDFLSVLVLDEGLLAGVYDGHGGDDVAKYCSINLLPRIHEKLQKGMDPQRALLEAFVQIDSELSKLSEEEAATVEKDEDEVEPGSTAVVALIQTSLKRLMVASVGDSRVILSKKGEAVDLANPHEPELERERSRIEAAGGKILANGYLSNSESTMGMSRSIGDFEFKSNKSLSMEQQMVIPVPDVVSMDLDGDEEFVMLTSDGIWMESQFLVNFVRERLERGDPLCEICQAVVSKADANDNMTFVIVKLNNNLLTRED